MQTSTQMTPGESGLPLGRQATHRWWVSLLLLAIVAVSPQEAVADEIRVQATGLSNPGFNHEGQYTEWEVEYRVTVNGVYIEKWEDSARAPGRSSWIHYSRDWTFECAQIAAGEGPEDLPKSVSKRVCPTGECEEFRTAVAAVLTELRDCESARARDVAGGAEFVADCTIPAEEAQRLESELAQCLPTTQEQTNSSCDKASCEDTLLMCIGITTGVFGTCASCAIASWASIPACLACTVSPLVVQKCTNRLPDACRGCDFSGKPGYR